MPAHLLTFAGDGTCASEPEQQIRDAFAKVTDVLAEAGLDDTHIVEMTSYHVDFHGHLNLFRAIQDSRRSHPGEIAPGRRRRSGRCLNVEAWLVAHLASTGLDLVSIVPTHTPRRRKPSNDQRKQVPATAR